MDQAQQEMAKVIEEQARLESAALAEVRTLRIINILAWFLLPVWYALVASKVYLWLVAPLVDFPAFGFSAWLGVVLIASIVRLFGSNEPEILASTHVKNFVVYRYRNVIDMYVHGLGYRFASGAVALLVAWVCSLF